MADPVYATGSPDAVSVPWWPATGQSPYPLGTMQLTDLSPAERGLSGAARPVTGADIRGLGTSVDRWGMLAHDLSRVDRYPEYIESGMGIVAGAFGKAPRAIGEGVGSGLAGVFQGLASGLNINWGRAAIAGVGLVALFLLTRR